MIELPIWEDSPETPIIAEKLNAYTKAIKELQNRDYIVEQGTEGIWTYRKWASGISECWGEIEEATYVMSNMVEYGTYFTNDSPKAFPVDLFVGKPVVNATAIQDSGLVIVCPAGITRGSFDYRLFSPTNVGYSWTGSISIAAKGRWK